MTSQTSAKKLQPSLSPTPSKDERYFQILLGAGLTLLWGASAWNGTIKGLLLSAWHGRFEDGTLLKNDYTGIFPLDFPVAVLVAFFFPGTSGQDEAFTLMLFDVYILLQLGYVWVYVEALRPGQKPVWIRNPVYIALLWQAIGGAVALPLYFLIHTRWTNQQTRSQVTDLDKARALPVAFFFGAVIPMLVLMAPTWLGPHARSATEQQNIIALFQPDPVYVSVLLAVFAGVLSFFRSGPASGSQDAGRASRWIRGLYLVSAIVSAVGHLYVLARVYTTDAESLNILRMYSPLAAGGASNAAGILLRGSWLFLQWDNIVISLAGSLWVYLLLKQTPAGQRYTSKGMTFVFFLLTAAFGPGSAATLGLYFSEGGLPEAT